ncbi:MAG: hypothetical protein FWF85_07670 [Clostridiales bacterium]|jgi:transcriptional regulator with XRE-family HTH domain|nr:hypothetical protein [Clostridiales bacterium]MDR2711833.1 hypothetical protein [Clostridiales bacterium]
MGKQKTALSTVMDELNINASELSRQSGVDRTLINRWRSGDRAVSRRSSQLSPLVEALLKINTDGRLDELLRPYMLTGENSKEALCELLTGESLTALPPRAAIPKRQISGEYVAEKRVLLGNKGFRKALLNMLDYLQQLPPGQEIIILVKGEYDPRVGNMLPFVLKFIDKLRKSLNRKARLLLINRRGYTNPEISEITTFSWLWLIAYLRGDIRVRYYEGELPEPLLMVASIKGYWSGRAEEDPEVEDNLYISMLTDPRDIRQDEALCDYYRTNSYPVSQYDLFSSPKGTDEYRQLWKPGPLPQLENSPLPDGRFFVLCSLPGIGLITKNEWRLLCENKTPPPLPEYLFRETEELAPGPHRIIFCREDIREALSRKYTRHHLLSALLHNDVIIRREMLSKQLNRLLDTMKQRGNVEVALLPRIAFKKLQVEMICWKNSVTVAWLQNLSQSAFTDDGISSRANYASLDFIWKKMLSGWKHKDKVMRQIGKWLKGMDLDIEENDSVIVRNWDVL